MKFIKSVKVDIQGVNQEFHLGDITIFIGRSNCGKTRILSDIHNRLQNLHDNFAILNARSNTQQAVYEGGRITLNSEQETPISSTFLGGYRQSRANLAGYSKSLAKFADVFGNIDDRIIDVGTSEIELVNHRQRPISEQGTGFHNMSHIFEVLNGRSNIVIIDEPENSQFPYGKVAILEEILKQSKTKQIIFATHDPTLINQYLIKRLGNDKCETVVYSYCGEKFERVDLTNCDPEIHVGFLSQTYSGKPVHLVVEGLTDYYVFQALLYKYGQYKKIPHYPKFINKVALSYMGGSQWQINRHHLPDPLHYDVLVVLDNEHSKNIQNEDLGKWSQIITKINDFRPGSTHWYCLSGDIENIFEEVFPVVSRDKPIGLSLQVWDMDPARIPDELEDIIKWCYRRAGAKIPGETDGADRAIAFKLAR